MKKIITVIGLLTISWTALAQTQDSSVFNQALGDMCDRRTSYIGEELAKEIATAASEGKLDVPSFFQVWHMTCDVNLAGLVSHEVKNSKISLPVFTQAYARMCDRRGVFLSLAKVISNEQALDIAELAAQKKLSINTFFTTWDQSCDYEAAKDQSLIKADHGNKSAQNNYLEPESASATGATGANAISAN